MPGGLPMLTYNPRNELKLEDSIKKAKDNLCKLMIVTGATKSGKTVLVKKVFPKENSVWYDGGSFSNEDDFWTEIITQLDGFTDVSESNEVDIINRGKTKGKAELTLKIPFPVMPIVGGEAEYEREKRKTTSKTLSRSGSLKTIAIKLLGEKEIPLIIDDFHYISREKQAAIVRAVKSLIFEGLPVIFIAIPHRRYDAIKVEKEMTGRVESVSIPPWKSHELAMIGTVGFPLLNLEVSDVIIDRLVHESISSPHLMQEFCKELCHIYSIEETSKEVVEIEDESILPSLFSKVATATGKVMFEKLKRGPRQRTDRLRRPTSDGEAPDIYGLVLKALANLKPDLDKVDYEVLRREIRRLSLEGAPEAHEVSRVLDYMSKIASSDESSTPVLDWQKEDRILHITDPFFAYYLRWGILSS